ncbi:hypothetical protein CASFOL_014581 [Castilleja foliolosa]|uniref:Uncharacterized protein n=1 Tax=Castilleja foliolosa TaxID=1961234 RepID=A0ABD3DSD6_9LAMI
MGLLLFIWHLEASLTSKSTLKGPYKMTLKCCGSDVNVLVEYANFNSIVMSIAFCGGFRLRLCYMMTVQCCGHHFWFSYSYMLAVLNKFLSSDLLFLDLGEELSKKQAAQETQMRKLRAQLDQRA